MFLSLLNRKEKLKFLDLAIYMVDIDGKSSIIEQRILDKMFAEVEDVRAEYTFSNTSPINETIAYFVSSNQVVKNVVFLNLVEIMMEDDFYNTSELVFLDQIQSEIGITDSKRREIISVVYEERDLREKASRIIKNN